MENEKKDLQVIQELLQKINLQFQNTIIPASNIIGNITISLSFRDNGELDSQYSVCGEIEPVDAVKAFQQCLETLLDEQATNVRTMGELN